MSNANIDNKQKTVNIIENYINKNYDLKYNEIKTMVEISEKGKNDFQDLNDRLINQMLRAIKKVSKNKIYKKDIVETLESDFSEPYNPLKEYFLNLPKHDTEQEYIRKLSLTLKCENQRFVMHTFYKWLIGIVASVFEEDKFNHVLPVLSGRQNIGKSTWIRKLLPENIKEYFYTGTIKTSDKDTLIMMSQKLIIDLDELTNMNKTEANHLKELITKPQISVRRPYMKYTEKLPRIASFIGSINDREFLYDLTGSRRFLCYAVTSIDYEHKIDIDKVWAEAYYCYKQGDPYWFEETTFIELNNEQFRVKHPFENKILRLFDVPEEEDERSISHLETCELYQLIFNRENNKWSDLSQFGKVLNMLGFSKRRETKRGKRANYYAVIFKETNDSSTNDFVDTKPSFEYVEAKRKAKELNESIEKNRLAFEDRLKFER